MRKLIVQTPEKARDNFFVTSFSITIKLYLRRTLVQWTGYSAFFVSCQGHNKTAAQQF